MEIEGLSKTNIRDLGLEIGKAGFVAAEFEPVRIRHNFAGAVEEPAIGHRPTRSWFAFGRYYRDVGYTGHAEDVGFHVGFCPAEHSDFDSAGPLDWPGTLTVFRRWLQYIRRHSEALSFEAAVEAGASLVSPGDEKRDETPFAPSERSRIADDLARIESLLRESTTRRDAAEEFIRTELAAVREELTRMKRGRWRSLFTGALVRMSAEQIVTSEKAQEIYEVAKEFALSHLPAQLRP